METLFVRLQNLLERGKDVAARVDPAVALRSEQGIRDAALSGLAGWR